MSNRIAILGAGNIGTSIARGLESSGVFKRSHITLTRRHIEPLAGFKANGFTVISDNVTAVRNSDVIILAVEPQQIDSLLMEIKEDLDPQQHTLISIVTGVSIAQLRREIAVPVPIIRAMPNTAIAVGCSMTCLAAETGADESALVKARSIFSTVGETLTISEEQMTAATSLGACGVAFFLRAIRAASQGGIEIGFHSQEAFAIAAQTAKGAAVLLQKMGNHPEYEIDRVTTPRGCTIAGLNQMEHEGFSSALIKGITVSARKADQLYAGTDRCRFPDGD